MVSASAGLEAAEKVVEVSLPEVEANVMAAMKVGIWRLCLQREIFDVVWMIVNLEMVCLQEGEGEGAQTGKAETLSEFET